MYGLSGRSIMYATTRPYKLSYTLSSLSAGGIFSVSASFDHRGDILVRGRDALYTEILDKERDHARR